MLVAEKCGFGGGKVAESGYGVDEMEILNSNLEILNS